MTWVLTSDDFWMRPENRELPLDAICVLLSAVAHSNKWLRDGRIPVGEYIQSAPKMSRKKIKTALELLAKAKKIRWDNDSKNLFYLIDLIDDQPTSEEIIKRRKTAKLRQKRFREKLASDECNGVTNGVSHGVSNGVSHAVSHATPNPYPNPNPNPERTDTDASPRWATSLGHALLVAGDGSPRERKYLEAIRTEWTELFGEERALEAFDTTISRVESQIERGKIRKDKAAYLGSALRSARDELTSGVELPETVVDETWNRVF
jgi:hypothetical protein